ncbi:MAG: hypothetical protein ACPGVG_15700 [Mycobacterium sp.]
MNELNELHAAARDSRLSQALALIDDARTLLADLTEEGGWTPQDTNRLTAARGFINSAVPYIQKVNREETQ